MGQDICSDIQCCRTVFDQNILLNFQLSENKNKVDAQNGHNEGSVVTGRIANQAGVNDQQNKDNAKEEKIMANPTIQNESNGKHFDPMIDLTDIRNTILDLKNPKQIFLNIDEVWKNEMKLIDRPLLNYYANITDNQYIRNGEDYVKFQILFKQHFPTFGVFFFEINLQSYEPKNGCDFTFGVVDYLQATKRLHCKGANFEDSYTYKVSKDFDPKAKNINVVNLNLKSQIDRQEGYISFFINDEQVEMRKLKTELMEPTVSLAPYIQTQGIGATFSWKESPFSRQETQRMSTIIEQQSSVHGTQQS